MEIRKILDILEAAPPQAGAVGMFGKNPNAPAADTAAAAPQPAGKPVVGTGLVAGSETQGGQVSYGSGAAAQAAQPAPKPAVAASSAPPPGGTPFTNPTPNVAASPAPAVAQPATKSAAPAAAPAAQTKTYGGGYDPTKVQYASGGPSASAQQSAASDASKKNVFGGGAQTAQQPVNNQSSGMTAQSQAQKPPAPAPAPTASQPPAQTSDQIATAALNAPAQNTSGASLGRQAGFGQMAENDAPAPNTPQQSATKNKKLPTVRDIVKADKKEIEDQFTDPNKESPYNKDTRAINPGSKPVNTIADFEESIEHELAEMRRLSGLPLNEKAVSKQQQKFMGMVHAMQKGEKVKGASPELKKAAKGMSKKDAQDFASTKHKGLPQKVSEGLNLTLDESGHTLNHIVNRFKHEVKKFLDGDMMSENLYDALYDYYLDRGDMPYGVAKAREGDPYAWTVDRFYNDITADNMNEAPVYEVAGDDTLQRLAELAGLSEDGPGQFGMRQNKTMSSLSKSDIERVRAADAEMDKIKRDSWKEIYPGEPYDSGDQKEKPKSYKDIAKQIMLKNEDGPGAAALYGKEKDKMTKTADQLDLLPNPTARIGSAMLRGADSVKDFVTKGAEAYKDLYMTGIGMPPDKYTPADPRKPFGPRKSEVKEQDLTECGDMGMDTEDRLNVSTNMSSDGTKSVNISAQGGKADDLLQMLKMAGMRPHDDHDHSSMQEPEVIMIGSDEMMDETGPGGRPWVPDDGRFPDEVDIEDHYNPLMDEELEEAKKRTTRYTNTPDEEYQTVASITRQGNDLNREKKQFAGKPRLGDNPMAESALDADLDAMLESILIREQDSKIEYDEVEQRVKADFPAAKRRDPASQEIPMEPESPESRVTGPRSMKVPGERTGTEKEVDEQSGNQPNPYPIGQDALSPQEKLNPTNNPNKSIVRGIIDMFKHPLKPGM